MSPTTASTSIASRSRRCADMTSSRSRPRTPVPQFDARERSDMAEVISTNPSTGETRLLGFAESNSDDVLALTQRALDAFDDYAKRPLAWRAGLLRSMAEELEGGAPDLVALAAT